MKKFTLLMVALLLSVMGVNAKTKTTNLWNGTDTGADIEVAKSKLVKGATLNLTFNWLGSAEGKFSCFWWNSSKGDSGDWERIKNWQWVNNGESYSFTLTDDEFEAITSDKLCFKTETPANMKFAKITQTETLVPTSTGDNLLSENWTVASGVWENKNFAAQPSAKIGDVILFNITVASGWTQANVEVKDSEGNDFENNSSYTGNFANETNETFEYEINNVNDLEKIQSAGFRVNAYNKATITSIQLLSYADSYDPVAVTIGSEGIATWSHSKNLDFTGTGITAYYASSATTGKVTLTPISDNTTWNYQGYILKGVAGTYYPKVIGNNSGTYPNDNLLKGNVSEGTVYRSAYSDYSGGGDNATKIKTYYRYIFAKNKTGNANIGFYKLTTDYTLAAHKAYLETPSDIKPTSNAPLMLDFGDGTTAIMDVFQDEMKRQQAQEDNVYYTLQGTRVQNPTKGLYILNGKKIIVK